MRAWLLIAVVSSGCAMHGGYEYPAHVVSADLFRVGNWYRFDFGRAERIDGTVPTEVLRVEGKRSDGWLEVTGLDGSAWTVNPATIVGFRPVIVLPAPAKPRLQAGEL